MNLPNWTGGCTRHEVRVAIEVKHLMRALGGPTSIREINPSPSSRRPLGGFAMLDRLAWLQRIQCRQSAGSRPSLSSRGHWGAVSVAIQLISEYLTNSYVAQ